MNISNLFNSCIELKEGRSLNQYSFGFSQIDKYAVGLFRRFDVAAKLVNTNRRGL